MGMFSHTVINADVCMRSSSMLNAAMYRVNEGRRDLGHGVNNHFFVMTESYPRQ